MKFITLIIISLLFSITIGAETLKNSDILYAVAKCEGTLHIFLNTRVHWETDGCLTDGYSSEEREVIEKITDTVSLCELMESTYEPCGKDTREEVVAKLKALGVGFDQRFQDFIVFEDDVCE